MNYSKILLAIILLVTCSAQTFAAVFTDDSDTEFQYGNVTEVNSTNSTLSLPLVNGTNYNASGIYYSRVFDLGSNPSTSIAWSVSSQSGTSILIATRSGNTTNAGASGWGAWSSSYATSTGSTVTSTSLRYLQYRITFAATNTSNTAVISEVTINATESNTTLTHGNANLTGATSGNYNWTTAVGTTLAITNVTARYKYNSSGSWSTAVELNATTATTFSFILSEPTGGWDTLDTTTLFIDINASVTNGSVETNTNTTFVEIIDFVNTLPVIDTISSTGVMQNAALTFTITATDADTNQVLTFTTNQTGATITALTNLSARFNWTPNGSQVGVFTVNITVNDTNGTSSTSFNVTVTDINDVPELAALPTITGYYGVRQFFEVVAIDLDTYQNLSFSMSPAIFRFTTMNRSVNSSTVVATTRYGWANVTPLDDARGVRNVTITVGDGTDQASINSTISIDYCGDAVCQSTYESATTCKLDCVDSTPLPGIALIAPDRNCVNSSMKVQAYDAQDRYTCYYQGRVTQDLALCNPLDGVAIEVYATSDSLFTPAASLTTDASGVASFTPSAPGQYRFIGTKDEYRNATMLVMVRACAQDIVLSNTSIIVPQPPASKPSIKEEDAQEEEPAITEAEQSFLAILFFYLIAPLLAASLLYLGNIFYDVNKDTLPWLLAVRIWGYEQRLRFEPQRAWLAQKTAPIVDPVMASLRSLWGAISPVIMRYYSLAIERLKSLRRKP